MILGPNYDHESPYKGETKRGLTQKGRRLCDHTVREESDGATSQEAGRWKEWILRQSL